MTPKPDAETLDHDAPDAITAWFVKARLASQVLGGLLGQVAAPGLLKPKRGRPVLAKSKAHVNIRLDADVLFGVKATGAGWQTRVNDAFARLTQCQCQID